jgi:hypothetical protein
MATTAQSLLALYGALDKAVIETGDPQIAATVERYLPGSTGSNAGWYSQVLSFLGHTGPRFMEAEVPDLRGALYTLRERRDLEDDSEAPTTVQLARMTYAIGALGQLTSFYPPQDWDSDFAETLELAGQGGSLLQLSRNEFGNRAAWSQFVGLASASALFYRPDVARVPLCRTSLHKVRGYPCVVLDTDFPSSTVSLSQVKDVVDPLNWAKCLSSFFCQMDEKDVRGDGWSRVLERVSTTCAFDWAQMVTPLKYWKAEPGSPQRQPSASLDFALDDDPLADGKGDGRMVVDEGFIRMISTAQDPAQPGVRVRTRKVAGFRDLAYVPAAIFACTMGYGDMGVEMLFGGAKKRPQGDSPPGWRNWQTSTITSPTPGDSPKTEQSVSVAPAGEQGDISSRAVTLAVEMLNDCIADTSEQSAAIASKWATGTAPIEETVKFGLQLAERLATDPWRYLERLRGADQGGDQ